MKSYAHLKPGQKGTLRLVEKYGTSLVCVRYRYDEKRGVKLKMVELVVEERPCRPSSRYRDNDLVAVGVRYTEKALREALRAAGGSGTRRNGSGGLRTARYGAMPGWLRG